MKQLEELKLNYRRTFKTDDGQVVLEDRKKRFAFETTTFSVILENLKNHQYADRRVNDHNLC